MPRLSSGALAYSWRKHQLTAPAGLTVLIAVVASLTCFATVLYAEARTWTDASGKNKVEAEFVRISDDGKKVVLKKKSGVTVQIPIDKLSAGDQEFLASQKKKPAGSPSAKTPAPASPDAIKSPDEIEAEAQLCKTAKEAVLVYKFNLAKPGLTSAQKAAVQEKLKDWQAKADENQVRLGTEWMKKEDADKIREKAEAKINYALELLRLRNNDLARTTLEEASKLDPDSIKADFLMGVIYGHLARNDKKSAEHFGKCLKREPENVSVLNNLAIAMVFQKKFVEAGRLWKTAATMAPSYRPLSQNIGSLLTMAGAGSAKMPAKPMKELSDLYEDLITEHGHPRLGKVVFVYTPPYGADWSPGKDGKPGAGGGGGGEKREAVVVSSGSGFVIHPNVILTNRHVIENASGLLVLDPKKPKGEPLAAELIAISKDADLALVRCNGLDAPPVPLVDTLPPRGTDIMVLGYPLGPSFGTTLKSTRGAMVAMPDASVDNMCLYDAVTNPGNSGGPLCDKKGRVAAVVRAVTGSVGGSYGAAIPIADALPFVKQHVPDFAIASAEATELDWPGVDAKISPSTVLILKKELLQTGVGVGDRKK